MDIVSVVAQPKGTNICVPPTSCAINNYRPDPIDATVKNQTVIPSAGLRSFKRRSFSGSLIGGLSETQEMLDFCGKHGITSDVEMIRMDQINEAYERMLKSDVKYRFVIDMKSLK